MKKNNYHMIKYEKLVRDKIPEILDKKGVPYTKRIANEFEYKQELCKKLVEETKEFSETPTTDELADVLQVILELIQLPDYKDTEFVRKNKLEEKGGFEKRFIVTGEK